MSIISEVISAIQNIEKVIGLKTDTSTDTIHGRLYNLENKKNDDVLIHSQTLGDVVVPDGYNVLLQQPVTFNSITIQGTGTLRIIV